MTSANLIASFFVAQPDILRVEPFGDGLINSSWVVHCQPLKSPKIFLQRMNQHVFNNPEQIIENLQILHAHISRLPLPSPNARSLQFPALVPTLKGNGFHVDDNGEYWRAFKFMENTQTLNSIQTLQQAQEIGYVVGRFHSLLCDIDLDKLQTTLPGFHVTPNYLQQFDQTYNQSENNNIEEKLEQCLVYIGRFRESADSLENARRANLLPTRLIHGDPKRDNILFDQTAKQAISLIDLDTMQPGLIHYDIGDCLRSCAAKLVDQDKQFSSMVFDLDIFETILKSYLEQTHKFILPVEYNSFYDAILLIPFELGLRFLTDYLNGDIYFKIKYPQQNLHKALQQFTLAADIEAKKNSIQTTIDRLKQQFHPNLSVPENHFQSR